MEGEDGAKTAEAQDTETAAAENADVHADPYLTCSRCSELDRVIRELSAELRSRDRLLLDRIDSLDDLLGEIRLSLTESGRAEEEQKKNSRKKPKKLVLCPGKQRRKRVLCRDHPLPYQWQPLRTRATALSWISRVIVPINLRHLVLIPVQAP